MSEVQRILEDMKEQLRQALPGHHFFFLLMPVEPDQMLAIGTDGLTQIEKRMVKHLQVEVNAALVDQRREQ